MQNPVRGATAQARLPTAATWISADPNQKAAVAGMPALTTALPSFQSYLLSYLLETEGCRWNWPHASLSGTSF